MSLDLWLFLLGLILFVTSIYIVFSAPRRKGFNYICPDTPPYSKTIQQIPAPVTEDQTQQMRTEDQ